MGLVIAGLRPAELATPPASCRLPSRANTNAPAASCRGSLTCRGLRGGGLLLSGRFVNALGIVRAFANMRWMVDGLRGRRRIHAAGLEEFFELVRGLRCCCGVAASCGSTLVGPTPLRPAGNPAGSPVEVPTWDGLGYSGPPARGTCNSAGILPAPVTRKHQRSRGVLPWELDVPGVARRGTAVVGEVRECAWDCQGVREHALDGRWVAGPSPHPCGWS